MPPPPKGKQGTKGQKQVYDENQSTLKFYLCVITAALVVYCGVFGLFFLDSLSTIHYLMVTLCLLIYLGSYQFMSYMARATFGAAGNLVDAGIDLNMGDGLSEHSKDLILMTAIVQTLSLLSDYMWLLLLLVPGRGFYLLWVNILGPWFFQEAPPEVDEKKQKKWERKMKQKQVIRR